MTSTGFKILRILKTLVENICNSFDATPIFEVNPMDACIEVFSMVVLRPFQLFGESLGIFYKSFLEQFSFFWKIPGPIILLISFVFILVFKFELKLSFRMLLVRAF